jgi:ankyrin repeat protein
MGDKHSSPYLGLDAAQGRRLAQRRLLLLDSSACGQRGSTDSVGRIVVEDGLGRMGGTETAALALEDCHERRLVTGAGAAALERRDPFSGETALIAQVQLGEYENAKRLLQAGADPNAATAGGERALLIASKAGREDLVELIAGFKADLDKGYDLHGLTRGMTALHSASEVGHLAVVQVLVKVGANVEAKDKDRWTSLHVASKSGHAAVVQTLLQHGGEMAATNKYVKTALDWAERCDDEVKKEEVKVVFAQHFAQVDITDQNKNMLLLVLSRLGVASRLPAVLLAGADLKHTDEDGWTSFHVASREGHAAVVQTLLQHGADVAATDNDGWTSFHVTSREGHAAGSDC